MSKYQVKENDFETPPENIYDLDLTGIDEKSGKYGPYLWWRWEIAATPEQDKYKGSFVTSLTPFTPTDGNQFGKFLQVLVKGTQVGSKGDTDELVDAKIRVKGFVTVEPRDDGPPYINCKKLLMNTVQMGVGIGRKAVQEKGAKKVAPAGQTQQAQPAPQAKPVTDEEIPW